MGRLYQLRDGTLGPFGLAMVAGSQDGRATVSSGGGAAVWVTTIPDISLIAIVLTNLQGSSPQVLAARMLQSWLQGQSN